MKRVPHARQRLGKLAEDLATERLLRAGATVVERNARIRYAELGIAGELDLIVLQRRVLVFVEVKAGRVEGAYGPERPALAVGPKKQARLRRLARAWMASAHPLPRFRSIRFDVVGVTFDHADRAVEVERIRGAF